MNCENCDEATVWFDHARKRWMHATVPATECIKPFPRPAGARPKENSHAVPEG